MNSIKQRIASLSPEKRAILEQRIKEKAANKKPKKTISKQSRSVPLPLSFSQQRMWLLDCLEPGNPAYNRPTNLSLIGKLDIPTLEKSLNAIICRHEILRTSFSSVDGTPIQIITPQITFKLQFIDLTNLSEAEQKTEIQKLTQQEAKTPFDLSQYPLFRVELLKLSLENYLLLLTFHHIIFDGWSVEVLKQDLAQFYQNFLVKTQSNIKDLSIQYADFSCWQRQQMQEKKLQDQLGYWKKKLGGELPILELPTDRRRAPIQNFKGAKQSIQLSPTLTQSLKALSHQEGVTLFMTLLAAFKVLLYRYTYQEDMIVGSPIAGRDRLEIEPLIGVFINTLVFRTQLQGALTFKELLVQVKEIVLEAYTHQELPFEKLVEELQPERHLNQTPLFQVLFQFRNIPQQTIKLQNLKVQDYKFDRGVTAFDLNLDIIEQNEGLFCQFEYKTDLFNSDRITRMMGHFQVLLEAIVTHLNQPISTLPLLTASEQHQLLVEWNQTQIYYPKELCIHQLFEQQAEKTPDAIAVVFEEQQLTYRELNERSNQLAHYLQQLGVKPEVLVGICIERSLEMIVGLLGILKAGGAYVPLDPDYPKERLAFMLEDANLSVLLTQSQLQTQLPQHQAQVICLDTDWERISQERSTNCSSSLKAENLAYVIYTSGSTGTPKGVLIQHQSAMNLLNSVKHQLGLTPQDILLSVTTLSFDIAVSEIFLPLIVGARLVLVSRNVASDGMQLLKEIENSGATFMQPTPATWRMLLAAGWQGSPNLKIVSTGEVLPRQLADRLLPKGKALWNLYGPTETTIWSSGYQVEANNQPITIGHPIANTQLYILDQYLQTVPIGVPGELFIGGAGLARGYLNRPELTLEKFIASPFNAEVSDRLYRTGDLARWLPTGQVECLGRIDNQVKIRGFRIELGEIETVLTQHPDIKETVVIVREDQPGDQQLVAYIVAKSNSVPTSKQLRHFLQQQLPEYMIPAVFVKLEAFPLTPNGKIDRHALPIPDASALSSSEAFVSPQTPIQKQLVAIWSEVLGIEKIGIYNNFFELGGHSLLATQVISRIHKTFDIEFPLQRLFEFPTVIELAEAIQKLTAQQSHFSPTPTIVAVSRETRRRKRSSFEE